MGTPVTELGKIADARPAKGARCERCAAQLAPYSEAAYCHGCAAANRYALAQALVVCALLAAALSVLVSVWP